MQCVSMKIIGLIEAAQAELVRINRTVSHAS